MDGRTIIHALGGRLVGSKQAKKSIARALQLLPDLILKDLVSHCWFLSSDPDAWAFVLKGSELAGDHIIFLSDDLFEQSEEQIRYTILHEVGHVVLNHRNSVGVRQSKNEIGQQEAEADQFARRYVMASQAAYQRLIGKEER